MNRRSFFSRLGVVVGAFAILPSATTYARVWKPTPGLYVLETPEMPFNCREFFGKWKFVSFDRPGVLYATEPRLEIVTSIESMNALPL
jgi:hypothetical protein